MLVNILCDKIIESPKCWEVLMKEMERHIKESNFDYRHVYTIVKSMGMRTQLCAIFAEYLVCKGYDSDELRELGLKRSIKFVDCMSLSLDQKAPLDSDHLKMWLVHVKVMVAMLRTQVRKGQSADLKLSHIVLL